MSWLYFICWWWTLWLSLSLIILILPFLSFKIAFLNGLCYNRIWCCWQVGITIAARRYDLDAVSPFQTSDILNLQPVVKHSVPVCSEARDLVEIGKVQLAEVCTFFCCLQFAWIDIPNSCHNSVTYLIKNAFWIDLRHSFSRRKKFDYWILWYLFQGMLNEAFALFSEAFSILQQVCFSILLDFLAFLNFFNKLSLLIIKCRWQVQCIERLPTVVGNQIINLHSSAFGFFDLNWSIQEFIFCFNVLSQLRNVFLPSSWGKLLLFIWAIPRDLT